MPLVADWRRDVDYDEIRRLRRARLSDAMARAGVDALVLFENANVRFAAGLRPLYAPNFQVRQAVVVTADDPGAVVFVHQDDTPHRRKTMHWLDPADIREFPTGVVLEGGGASALAPLGDALRQLGFTSGRVGTDIGTPASLGNLAALLGGSTLVDANALLNQARMVKSPGEVVLMRHASAIVDSAMRRAVAMLAPGVRECDVLAEVMHEFYTHNAEVPQCNLIVCTGDNTAPMQRFAGDQLVRYGDLVFMDIGACFNGMFSEETRTVVVGTPHETQREVYRLVHALHSALIDAVRPGATGEDLQSVAAGVLDGHRFGGNLQKMIIAHGIGVGYAESPYIAPPGRPTPKLVLEEGMMLAIVPTVLVEGVPGGAGVRLEDVVAVTSSGAEVLTVHPYDDALLA
ncbi:aminopeptidase P family protein [Jiangella ureilytica]|uniref:Aminopeptidase P family protein n=1 Tax=Jiangella ureilytica TaxID=2530374 RepID=A0A4R4RQB9_9ACTN|nr:Xaa-Pro peptidase family protein [Jiangella ureilytica]TDC50922.1 aminopeptidase P family protein [Jiangella ureilytica]